MTLGLKKLEIDEEEGLPGFSSVASMKRALGMARDLERNKPMKPAVEDRRLLDVPADGWLSGPGRKSNLA